MSPGVRRDAASYRKVGTLDRVWLDERGGDFGEAGTTRALLS